MRSRLVAFATLAAVAACQSIVAPPIRSADVYEWRYLNSKGAGGVDTLSFHWLRTALPVRIYVAPGSALEPYVAQAITRWESAFLYGEWRGVMVNDSANADVIFENVIPAVEGGLLRLRARAPECTGETDGPDPDIRVWALPIHSYVWSNTGGNVPGLAKCYSLTVTHEMGHTLGIIHPHSPNATDIMYAFPVVDSLSQRDRQTIVTAYHTNPNVTAVKLP